MAFFAKTTLFLAALAVASAAPQYFAGAPAAYPGVFRAPYALPRFAPAVAPVAVAHAPVAVAPPPLAYHAPLPVAPLARYAPAAPFVPINSQSFDIAPDNSYNFHYESADGSARSESGAPQGLGVQGSYTYAGPEGPVSVDYVADENGFQPSGPNVHPEIQKAVAEQVAFARIAPKAVLPPPAVYHAPVAPAVYHAPVAPAVYHAPVAAPAVYHAPVAAPAFYHAPVAAPVPAFRPPFAAPGFRAPFYKA